MPPDNDRHLDRREQAKRQNRQQQSSPGINDWCVDLTELANARKARVAVGRDKVFALVTARLALKDKPNVLLVGDPGVGKSAIGEGLAHELFYGPDTPRSLSRRRVYRLNTLALISGTSYRGELENRLKLVIDHCTNKTAILFIDEIHQALPKGSAEGSYDLAQAFMEPLARDAFSVVGATTFHGYSALIERDPGIRRRFQRIDVPEMTRDSTLMLLTEIKSRYEKHHGVIYLDEALRTASNFRHPTLRLPDAALELIDRAGGRAASKNDDHVTSKHVDDIANDMKGDLYSGDLLTLDELARFMAAAKDNITHIVENAVYLATVLAPLHRKDRRDARLDLELADVKDQKKREEKLKLYCSAVVTHTRKEYSLTGDSNLFVEKIALENGSLNARVLNGVLDAALEERGYAIGDGSGIPREVRSARGGLRTTLLFSQKIADDDRHTLTGRIVAQIVDAIKRTRRYELLADPSDTVPIDKFVKAAVGRESQHDGDRPSSADEQ